MKQSKSSPFVEAVLLLVLMLIISPVFFGIGTDIGMRWGLPAGVGWIVAAAVMALLMRWVVVPYISPHTMASTLSLLVLFIMAQLYGTSVRAGLLTADNAEFQWAAATWSIAHPPGFGLYTFTTALWSDLVGVEPAVAVNYLAFFSALITLGLVASIAKRLVAFVFSSDAVEKDRMSNLRAEIAGTVAVLTLGTSTTFWAQATQAGIRMWTVMFLAAAVLLLLQWYERLHTNGRSSNRHLFGLAVALGLGITHHLSLAFPAVAIAVFVVWADPQFLRRPRSWAAVAAAVPIALLPWLDVWLREPSLRPADEFFTYVLGLGFQGDFFYFITPADLWVRLGVMADILTWEFNIWLLLLAAGTYLFVFTAALWRTRWGAWMKDGLSFGRVTGPLVWLAVLFIIYVLLAATYRAPQTAEYVLPAYITVAVAAGLGTALLFRHFDSTVSWLFLCGVLAAGLAQAVARMPTYYDYLHNSRHTEQYLRPIINHAPENARVLADWHWYTPLRYLQSQGTRPDLDVRFVYPQTADYGADWAAAIQTAWHDGVPVVATHFDPAAYADLPPYRPLGEAYLFPQQPLTAVPDGYEPLDISLGDAGQALGYEVRWPPAPEDPIDVFMSGQPPVMEGEPTAVHLVWRPHRDASFAPDQLRLFAHLVAADGTLRAQDDVAPAVAADGLTETRFELTPRPGRYGPHTLLIGAYLADGTPLTERQAVTELTVQGSQWPPLTQHPGWWQPADEHPIVGYDVDRTLPDVARLYLHRQVDDRYQTDIIDLPADGVWENDVLRLEMADFAGYHYVPFGRGVVWLGDGGALGPPVRSGQSVSIAQTMGGRRPIFRDLGLATDVIGYMDDGRTWAWLAEGEYGDIPATGALPTLKWIAGTRIGHPDRISIPPTAVPGQTVEGSLRVYDVFTNRPVPILDERFAADGRQWVPFARTVVE